MEQPKFLIGSESRFAQFISKLNEKDKIALISHTDLDGIASAKIVNEVIQADLIKFINYTDLNESLIKELKAQKIKKIIFTDLSFTNPDFIKSLEKYFQILIIDHHLVLQDYNSEKTVFLNAQGFCAAYMCYYLFSKIQNIEELDWLIACACISDWAYTKNPEFMSLVFKKYGDEFALTNEHLKKQNINKSGKFWDLQWILSLAIIYFNKDLSKVFGEIGKKFGEIGKLEKCAQEVQEEIDLTLKKFEKEKVQIKDGFFYEFSPKFKIGSMVSTIISEKHWEKRIILALPREKYYNLNARRQDGKEDISNFLKNLINGLENAEAGGHIKAAGGHVLLKDKNVVIERLRKL